MKNLNFHSPISVKTEEIPHSTHQIEYLRKELDEIGAVNELAPHQYDEYKNNYRQLSIRINELEEQLNDKKFEFEYPPILGYPPIIDVEVE